MLETFDTFDYFLSTSETKLGNFDPTTPKLLFSPPFVVLPDVSEIVA